MTDEIGKTTRRHMSMSIRGALMKTNKELQQQLGGCLTFQGRRLITGREIRDALEWQLHHGVELAPCCSKEECPDFDPKTGCPGHPMDEQEAQHG
jgi:hypothetical protein